ncbi:MerR family transcriptional regulator [Streptomyces sp. CB01881]|uniref:MerR family transcriptional regulator n=1 Tax=Streptomyces sp. CB01881 TaxID=2078691 RepID=UPI000CDCC65C|nr:MerR family transcriptional regulator [Streptomyces sp. CB01881]AUY52411.1 MerR family transcriptional regulator [Streptomyces sp. CB01881]TYC71837.1 MerR family transcriptional regulator [Streptomyces sp. CB01881]
MLIGELARATDSTARALRHYEQAGLIDSSRAANGYRQYDEAAAVRVRNIRGLLAAGFTLEDVRLFLPCLDGDVLAGPPSAAAVRLARERLAVLERRIAAQTAARDRLVAALSAAEEAGAAERGTARAPERETAGAAAGAGGAYG